MVNETSATPASRTLETVPLLDLIGLQSHLIHLCGSNVPPWVNSEVGSSRNSMAAQEMPPRNDHQDPLSSPITWAASFISADVRAARIEKGWSGHVTQGLSVSADALHQQFINMGRKAKGLIDMSAIPAATRAAIGRIFVPGKPGSARLEPEEMAKLREAMSEENCPTLPLKLQLGDTSDTAITLHFKNSPVGHIRQTEEKGKGNAPQAKPASLFYTLIGLHTLSNGNASRWLRTPDGAKPMPEQEMINATGAAEQAVVTLDRVRQELERQLTEMKKHDIRLKDVEPKKVIAEHFDINREALKKIWQKEAGFLQVAVEIAKLTNREQKTILEMLSLIGETQHMQPVLENADQARRLVQAGMYRAQNNFRNWDGEPNSEWPKILKKYALDPEKLHDTLTDVANKHPGDSQAIVNHPETKKFIALIRDVAAQKNDRALQNLPLLLSRTPQQQLEDIDRTMRGNKSWIDRNIIDTRRRSATVQALKEGYSSEQIGRAIETTAGQDGKKFSRRLLDEIHKEEPEGPARKG
ncbi:MAG: hypothetical protein EBV03_01770 [Proteobacteria bacterium]|nr:hypothetical protein [Pseudomonadota bacterium]